MHNLTSKEQQLLKFIEDYQLENGSSPTVREMREYMKLKSDGFIIYCLKSLAKKGAIQKGDTPRSIKLLPRVQGKLQADLVKLPILGSIPAGGPVISEESVEDWISVDSDIVKNPTDVFVLKVRGDSMIGAGIFEGDLVIADFKKQPRKGDIVVALIDGGSTVKRYMTDNGKIYLKPENPNYENIYPESELQIQGVVTALFRQYKSNF